MLRGFSVGMHGRFAEGSGKGSLMRVVAWFVGDEIFAVAKFLARSSGWPIFGMNWSCRRGTGVTDSDIIWGSGVDA